MKLSPHFSLSEFTDSTTAARNEINNDPPLEVVANLKRLAAGMERVRVVLNASPVIITSGYRGEELEKIICAKAYKAWCQRRRLPVNDDSWEQYFESKDHPQGNAADFKAPSFGPVERVMQAIYNSDIEYDQLILEFGQWVHISFSDKPRKQALIIDAMGTRSYQ